ncbi:MAG: MBL fold metallo-hydrolase [Methylophaga sp.]|nr:MBL fold metallo-hydrolase [Methylophaga sp.]
MYIKRFTVGAFQVNTYLVEDEATGQCAIIDTGESLELLQQLSQLKPEPDIRYILLTHGHLDHAGALLHLQAQYQAMTFLPRLELPMFERLPEQGSWFGMPSLNRECGRVDYLLDDGDTISLGKTTLHFISTPGHTPGQGCYYDDHDIFVGDTLFAGSIGRTDLPMGNAKVMQDSLNKLMQLPGNLRVHSGHGPVTTLADEKQSNPFLAFLREK